jgi:hypothetical protein
MSDGSLWMEILLVDTVLVVLWRIAMSKANGTKARFLHEFDIKTTLIEIN